MSNWTEAELAKIATADDLYISPLREDGVTYGTPTWIWSVVVDGVLYVRAYNGQNSRWYKAAMAQKRGRVAWAGSKRMSSLNPSRARSMKPLMRRTGRSTQAVLILPR